MVLGLDDISVDLRRTGGSCGGNNTSGGNGAGSNTGGAVSGSSRGGRGSALSDSDGHGLGRSDGSEGSENSDDVELHFGGWFLEFGEDLERSFEGFGRLIGGGERVWCITLVVKRMWVIVDGEEGKRADSTATRPDLYVCPWHKDYDVSPLLSSPNGGRVGCSTTCSWPSDRQSNL